MKAVVLGATGHVGNAFVREFLGRRWQVVATSRRSTPAANVMGLNATFASGDAQDPAQLDAWVRDADVVVDAAAPYHLWLSDSGYDDPAERMEVLIDTVSRHGCKLIYVSSFTTIDRSPGYLERFQDDVLGLVHPYFTLKKELEGQVLAASARGLPAVIVNPTQCIGPWDVKPVEYCLIPALLGGDVPATSNHEINVIDVRDVAAVSLHALQSEVFGEPILLAGQNTTLDMFMTRICAIGGVEPPGLEVLPQLGAWAAYGNELLGSVLPAELKYPSLGMILLLAQQWSFPSRHQRQANVRPQPLSKSLADAIDWYGQIGYLAA